MTVLVTGSARRIGRAVSCALAACGWRVLVHSRVAGDADAAALAAEIGGVALAADLSAPGGAEVLFASALAVAPDLDAVVNNAAVFDSAAELPAERSALLEAVNLEAPCVLTRLLGARLASRGVSGAVVNLLDSRVLRANVPRTPYAMSKAGLLRATRSLAAELAPWVRVNAVAPGPVLPPVKGGSEKGGGVLLSRRPTPEDVAAAVSYLLSATSVTGAVLPVDAGQSLLEVNHA